MHWLIKYQVAQSLSPATRSQPSAKISTLCLLGQNLRLFHRKNIIDSGFLTIFGHGLSGHIWWSELLRGWPLFPHFCAVIIPEFFASVPWYVPLWLLPCQEFTTSSSRRSSVKICMHACCIAPCLPRYHFLRHLPIRWMTFTTKFLKLRDWLCSPLLSSGLLLSLS